MKTKLTLLSVCLILTANVFAFDFVIDKMAYNITSPTTVETTWLDGSHNADVIIPSQVVYSSTTYAVTAIGPNTFNGYGNSLNSVSIPQSVTSIGHYAFYGCDAITTISIPGGLTYLGERAFCGCSKLNSITIPKSLSRIYSEAFMGCESINSVTFELPSSLTQIDFAAFEYCGHITTLNIPNTVTTIGGRAFQFCGSLQTINIPGSVNSIGLYALDDTPWYNNQPEGLVYAGNVAYAYKGTMPENTSIVLNEGTTGISEYAFYSQRNLSSLSIPASVSAIGRNAFEYCSGLQTIYSHAVSPINLESSYDVFKDANKTTSTLYVPVNSKSAYGAANQWQDFTNIVESNFSSTKKLIDANQIYCVGHQIFVSNNFGKYICLYDMNGKKISAIKNTNEVVCFSVDKSGVYVVAVDNRFKKIVLK